MTRGFGWLVSLLLLLTLSACGFHMRGLGDNIRPLPFKTLYIGGSSSVAEPLRKILAVDPRVTLVKTPDKADAILNFTGDTMTRQLTTINSSGQASEYTFSLRVPFKVILFGHEHPDFVMNAHRDMTYNPSSTLGKGQEEAMLWSDMRTDIARLITYRLQALSNSNVHADASGGHAVTQP